MNLTEQLWRKATLPVTATIQQAIANLDQVAIKIVLVVNEHGELEGTISDGDIRRGLLKGLDLNSPITNVIHRNALVVPPEMTREMVMQLMAANKIQQIPAVDEHRHVVGLHLWDEIATPTVRPNLMVIMAGGMGTRLRPHTENCPKPLLPVAGKPMLEHIIEHAKLEGFSHFVLAIHYLGHMIEDKFGNGERLGVQIDYLREQSPLGTAGALGLLNPRPDAAFVVTNGDVITDINYGELLDFHLRHSAAATMAVRVHEWQHPFGVVQTDGIEIVGFEEKPIARSHINAGVYALDPNILSILRHDARCDMPTLFERLQAQSKRTVAYPMHEPWLDVGRPDDLNRANNENVN
ncbi:nucleotidyltransferase family protein [Rhodoferax sp.]|uniref:nucleotidyltransferase family protein n=1 Tax=Rhodoferax sp. TaxID=50421 RepID=UPI0008B343A3|nr:nucleotidyltransferase family protein [Rhodoferax sp.]OGB39540.1 MAG: nucleotidyl transferase [Burkholderiales bacterium RIFOXYC2_FULL_59_8]OGB50075.1 MAG: nucleotidyl transferase [Burkholderiales bacterium RIFOXYD12_FULL_59_19]OGB76993.1 MAG: nucleotidyl transferase [Burkholderiales bacterium RIFOXYC12_FULL_60_6]OGB84586.1 MAG: nucleotidyl transferase [Burkholderiales bacterium RIFOXYD2_FULL_59_8]MDO8319253.1 nucleotidyltransferase family protein [Rhodoferax sp.]